MQLPKDGVGLTPLRQFTTYTVRRLKRRSLDGQAQDCQAAFRRIREAQLAVDDAEDPVTEAIADRDAADDSSDSLCEECNRGLTARVPDAKKQAPWTLIFPEGSLYYTASPVGEHVKRYGQLVDRMRAHLPADDPLVESVVPRLTATIEEWKAAQAAFETARTTLEAKRAAREHAETDWRTLMDRLYSGLRAELGRAEAEQFFRKPERRKAKNNGGEE